MERVPDSTPERRRRARRVNPVETVVGQGTTCHLTFPAAQGSAAWPELARHARGTPGEAPASAPAGHSASARSAAIQAARARGLVRGLQSPRWQMIDDRTRPAGALTIYLAEDDNTFRSILSMVLRREGCRVREFRNGADLLAELRAPPGPPVDALLVLDHRMPELDGLTLIQRLREAARPMPFVLCTAFGGDEVARSATALGALCVLHKPFDFEVLRKVVRGFAARGAGSAAT